MNEVKNLIENVKLLSYNVRNFFQKRAAELGLDVTYEMVRVLFILDQRKYSNQQQIADITLKNKASLTSLIDNLQKRELVARNEDPVDRRNKIITLTSKGKDLVKEVRPVFDDIFKRICKDVSESEIQVLNAIILKMNRAVE